MHILVYMYLLILNRKHLLAQLDIWRECKWQSANISFSFGEKKSEEFER